ncbi:MAG: BatD family protein [Candidatus Omnitrophica bacterium]|nr:BatD family protein [Candidatus Omnitrophota bacterium]
MLLATQAVADPAPADLAVSSRVDKIKVSVGEPLTFSVTITGPVKTTPRVDIGSFEGFHLMTTGQSQQVDIRQGQMQLAVTLQYLLVAEQPGTHKLGPVTVEHEGKRYTAPFVQVEVAGSAQALPGKERKRSRQQQPRIYGGTIL